MHRRRRSGLATRPPVGLCRQWPAPRHVPWGFRKRTACRRRTWRPDPGRGRCRPRRKGPLPAGGQGRPSSSAAWPNCLKEAWNSAGVWAPDNQPSPKRAARRRAAREVPPTHSGGTGTSEPSSKAAALNPTPRSSSSPRRADVVAQELVGALALPAEREADEPVLLFASGPERHSQLKPAIGEELTVATCLSAQKRLRSEGTKTADPISILCVDAAQAARTHMLSRTRRHRGQRCPPPRCSRGQRSQRPWPRRLCPGEPCRRATGSGPQHLH